MKLTIQTQDGRTFTCIGEEPYQRRDGAHTTLRVWACACAQCGAQFTVKTPASVTQANQSKSFGMIHCEEHRLNVEEVRARRHTAAKKGSK